MDQLEVEGLIKDLNTRTKRIEQILPTLATKEDLKVFPTRDEVKTLMEEEGKRTRRHFDVVAEGLKESIRIIANGHKGLDDHERRITKLEARRSRR